MEGRGMRLGDCDNILDVAEFFNDSEKNIVLKLQAEGLIKPLKKCSKCRRQEILYRNKDYKGNYAAYCRTCKKYRSLCAGTFFENVHLSFKNVFLVMMTWICHIAPKPASQLIKVTRLSVIQFYRFFRDIASWKLVSMPEIQFGGAGSVVQIDESVITKRKYNRGRKIPQKWVFGMYDEDTGKGLCVYVPNRSRQTLIPIIRRHIRPLSTIWSDEWRAYQCLDNMGYIHETVNHSREFKSITGVCTNKVELYWKRLKQYCRQTGVLSSKFLPEHVDEFMYKERMPSAGLFGTFLRHVKERYPC